MEPILSVSDLRVEFDSHSVLSAISFELNSNETMAIIGPNGAGKTVLFRALLGLIPHSGKIKWKKGVKIGYVPQRLSVDPDLPLTTTEFFTLKGDKLHSVKEALSLVGLEEHLLNKKIGILSGGELQRVSIAWALSGNPDILLFDEPTSGVDISAEETIYGHLKKLQEKKKFATLIISHDLNVVYRFANKVVCLNKEMVCYGPPLDVLDKQSLQKLYGNDIGVYQHGHKHDEH